MINSLYPSHRAFTLIELLIVVAIIAILAAIAVPNFLEAQVRAKISRTKADLYSIATALETYMVDHNQYPSSSGIHSVTGAVEWQNSEMSSEHKFIAPVLTTPIAYMSSIPKDPFATNFPAGEARHYFYTNLAIEKVRNLTPPWPGPGNAFENRLVYLGMWTMWGCGPDLDRNDLAPDRIGGPASTNWHLGFYDPTNGTISNGDIFRSQKYVNLGW
ncbi:MAG: prepilin-type N-terminal cleavage/methylation domain-containing protein [Candidatus Sumerlaeia bacterium]|nr:prepilin-type N-terminal cleavage/methylation domain-containing protein [Candidatus Sumerlaeia bacterium]